MNVIGNSSWEQVVVEAITQGVHIARSARLYKQR